MVLDGSFHPDVVNRHKQTPLMLATIDGYTCMLLDFSCFDCKAHGDSLCNSIEVSFDSNGPVQEALDYLHYLRHEKLDALSEKLEEPITELNFITEAWLQIADCRRVLKWISVYRNCLSEHESAKSDFLQHLHDDAESFLWHLHRLAENELQVYLVAESPVRGFNDYRAKLIHLSSFTQDYFKKLIRYIKTYFKDIVSADHHAEHGQDSRSNISVEASTEIKLATSNGQHCSLCDWTCYVCTYAGNPSSKNHCAICEHYQ